MTITNGYATLAEYQAWITMRGGSLEMDPADDVVVEALIEGASRYVDRETGKRFYKDSTDQTRYYTPDNPYLLKIDPISAAPTSVSVDSSGTRSYVVLTAGTDYDMLPDNAALEGQPYTQIAIIPATSRYSFPDLRRGVKVVGLFGFPSVPHDVREAVLAIVQNINAARSGQSSAGRVTVTAGGVVIRPEDVPPFAQKVIRHYRSFV